MPFQQDTKFWGKRGAGALIIARDTGRVFLVLRSPKVREPGTWGLIGGAIDEGESPDVAVRREVYEEIAYTGDIELHRGRAYIEDTFTYHNFIGVVESEFSPQLNWESDDAGWFDINKLPSPLHFGVQSFFNSDMGKIKKIIGSLSAAVVESRRKRAIREDKADFGSYDTWSDSSVAYVDSDPNVTDTTKQFALLADKVADLLGLPEPIITSALRPPERQIKAMLTLWKRDGSQYVKDLYGKICNSCSPDAGEIAAKLVNLWDESKRPLIGGIPSDIMQQSIDIVKKHPLSSHQDGNALDYGTKTNSKDNISKILDYIKQNGLADFKLIDETKSGAPHWHVTVVSVSQKGQKFLNASNEDLQATLGESTVIRRSSLRRSIREILTGPSTSSRKRLSESKIGASVEYDRTKEGPKRAFEAILKQKAERMGPSMLSTIRQGSHDHLRMLEDALDEAGILDASLRALVSGPFKMIPPAFLLRM